MPKLCKEEAINYFEFEFWIEFEFVKIRNFVQLCMGHVCMFDETIRAFASWQETIFYLISFNLIMKS